MVGLFKNLRQGVKAVSTMVAEVNAANAAAETAMPVTILNPSPQEEVDRLLAAGGVTRGVVVRATHEPQHGERAQRFRVDVRVRGRLAAGALGDVVNVKVMTSWKVAALLDPGLEIPVLLDRTTGLVTEIPADALRDELEPRFDEAAERRTGDHVDPDFQAAIDLPRDIKNTITRLGKDTSHSDQK